MKTLITATLAAVILASTLSVAVAGPGDRCPGSTRPDWQQEALCPAGGGDSGSE